MAEPAEHSSLGSKNLHCELPGPSDLSDLSAWRQGIIEDEVNGIQDPDEIQELNSAEQLLVLKTDLTPARPARQTYFDALQRHHPQKHSLLFKSIMQTSETSEVEQRSTSVPFVARTWIPQITKWFAVTLIAHMLSSPLCGTLAGVLSTLSTLFTLSNLLHVFEELSLTEWQRKEPQSNCSHMLSHFLEGIEGLCLVPGHRVVQDFVLGHRWTVSGTSIYTMKSNEIVTACDRKKNPSVVWKKSVRKTKPHDVHSSAPSDGELKRVGATSWKPSGWTNWIQLSSIEKSNLSNCFPISFPICPILFFCFPPAVDQSSELLRGICSTAQICGRLGLSQRRVTMESHYGP